MFAKLGVQQNTLNSDLSFLR